jgi:hypothetical protein
VKTLKVDLKKPINIRLTSSERVKIQSLADKYAQGNLSHWMRYASLNCIPKKEDLVEQK